MDRVNQFSLYRLAIELRRLPEYDDTVHRVEAEFLLTRMKAALLPYLSDNPPLRLTISRGPAKELADAIDRAIKQIKEMSSATGGLGLASAFAGGTTESRIESWHFISVRSALDKFEAVLSAECEARPAFIAPERGIYDTEDLVNDAASAIPEVLRPVVSSKAQKELDSGGRCLAFGLFTAAGFHMCRAVEAVMEDYYHRFTGEQGTLRSWHEYIQALQKVMETKHKLQPTQQTIVYINQLRDSSRNPIMHPRVVLDEADAFELFNLAHGVICRMAQELVTTNKASRRKKRIVKAVP